MTIRISLMDLALTVEARSVRNRRVTFGRPAPELAITAAALISATSVLTGIARIAGVL